MPQVRWRRHECLQCEVFSKTRTDRKVLASIIFCDKPQHLLSDCEAGWECPATPAIREVVQRWSMCPFHGALESHFERVREMRGETIRIEAEKKLGGWVELHVWSFSKRSGRILYSLSFTIYKGKDDDKVHVRVNDRDEVFYLPVRDFLTYAPAKWIEEVLRAFTDTQTEPLPESANVSAA
jgi:hypothetical protein